MDRGLTDEALAAASASLKAVLAARAVRGADDLAADAAVVLDGLVAAAADGATEVDRGEALALATLLGRRLSVAGAVTDALLLLFDELEARRPGSRALDAVSLRLALVEGYARGVREAAEAEHEERAARSADALVLGGGLVLVALPALLDEARIAAAVDAVGRAMLSRDAKACVAWVGADGQGSSAAFTGALQLVEHARMVGAKIAIAVRDVTLRTMLEKRLEGEVAVTADVGAALAHLGYGVKETGVLRRWLKG